MQENAAWLAWEARVELESLNTQDAWIPAAGPPFWGSSSRFFPLMQGSC